MASIPFDLKGKRVFVAGHRGMVGAALVRRLASEDVELLTVPRSEVGKAVRVKRWLDGAPPLPGLD